jgi:hypothetical protein
MTINTSIDRTMLRESPKAIVVNPKTTTTPKNVHPWWRISRSCEATSAAERVSAVPANQLMVIPD